MSACKGGSEFVVPRRVLPWVPPWQQAVLEAAHLDSEFCGRCAPALPAGTQWRSFCVVSCASVDAVDQSVVSWMLLTTRLLLQCWYVEQPGDVPPTLQRPDAVLHCSVLHRTASINNNIPYGWCFLHCTHTPSHGFSFFFCHSWSQPGYKRHLKTRRMTSALGDK